MSVDQMLACSDASDSAAEAGLPYSDSLGSVTGLTLNVILHGLRGADYRRIDVASVAGGDHRFTQGNTLTAQGLLHSAYS